ncbi:MAG: T9SS type A sorting domain-containing protein, partial [Candidatus Zixiibacteriota bacterium]
SQNYPNPFNAVTRIQFYLPQACHIELEICNIVGQAVSIPVRSTLEAGTHIVEWDGRDSGGRLVASGIYFCRLKAGDFVDTKKMVLLK